MTLFRTENRSFLFLVPALVFMLAIFAAPMASILAQSISDPHSGSFSLAAFEDIFTSSLFYRILKSTLIISVSATVTAVLVAYPVAYYLAKQPARRRAMLMILVLVPFWTSVLVKGFAFTILLGSEGVVNTLLAGIGLPKLPLMFNKVGVLVGMTHFLIPFLVFPLLASLMALPRELPQAARLMGASPARIFFQVTLPLSLPGLLSGTLLAFILSLGFFVVPAMLGGRSDMMLSNLVDFYIREVFNTQMASAIALLLLMISLGAALILSRIPGGAGLLGGEKR